MSRLLVPLIDDDDRLAGGSPTDQGGTPRAPALDRAAGGVIEDVLDFIDTEAVVGDVPHIAPRLVLGVPLDEIEVHLVHSHHAGTVPRR